MKKVLRKIIKNGVTYWLPEGGGGGGGDLDINSVNALIDMKLGNYDSLFQMKSGLYKILNSIDENDELGLESGETRDDIVADSNAMSKISHCYAVMCYIANSSVAMNGILSNFSATKEVSECRNSISIIAESELASELYLGSVNGITNLFTYETAQDTFFTSLERKTEIISENIMVIVNNNNLLTLLNTDEVVKACIITNQTAINTIAGDSDKLEIVKNNTMIMNIIASNFGALSHISDNDFFEYILKNATYLDTCSSSTTGAEKINSYNADDLLEPVYYWTGDLEYKHFADLAEDDNAVEIILNNDEAMMIVNCNNEAIQYFGYNVNEHTVLYCPLDSNHTTNDISGNGHNLTATNTTFGTYEGVGSAFVDNSIQDNASLSTDLGLPSGTATISIWFNIIGFASGVNYGAIFQFGNTRGNGALGVWINKSGEACVGGWQNGYETIVKTANLTGGWHNLVVTRNGGTFTGYIDNELYCNYTNSNVSTANIFSIGGQPIDNSDGYGYFADCIIEDKVWTDEERTKYYLKMRKRWKESKLNLYRELQYIQSNGSQYIRTGVNVSKVNKMILEASDFFMGQAYADSNSVCLFGSSYNSWWFSSTYYTYNGARLRYHTRDGRKYYDHNGVVRYGEKNTITYNFGNVVINGTEGTYQGADSSWLDSENASVCLWYCGNNSWSNYKMYSCKIYDSNNNLLRDFIPVERISDGVAGLYDKVTNVFYSNNSGSGNFIKGPAIAEQQDFQEVQYIQSDGNSYINTGIVPKAITEFEMSFEPASYVGTYCTIMGTRVTVNANAYWIGFYAAQDRCYVEFSPQNTDPFSMSWRTLDTRYNLTYHNKVISDGTNSVTLNHTQDGVHQLYLFTGNHNGTAQEYSSIRLYQLRFYENNTLIHNFMPCYRKSDGVIGLYDKIKGLFYTNIGSGNFTKGEDVN